MKRVQSMILKTSSEGREGGPKLRGGLLRHLAMLISVGALLSISVLPPLASAAITYPPKRLCALVTYPSIMKTLGVSVDKTVAFQGGASGSGFLDCSYRNSEGNVLAFVEYTRNKGSKAHFEAGVRAFGTNVTYEPGIGEDAYAVLWHGKPSNTWVLMFLQNGYMGSAKSTPSRGTPSKLSAFVRTFVARI